MAGVRNERLTWAKEPSQTSSEVCLLALNTSEKLVGPRYPTSEELAITSSTSSIVDAGHGAAVDGDGIDVDVFLPWVVTDTAGGAVGARPPFARVSGAEW